MPDDVSARELAHHEALYSGEAQRIFARAARALRRHMVGRILAATGATASSRVLSLGCGIGDTEILLAPHVGSITGVDLSPTAIRQARADAVRSRVTNIEFLDSSAGAAELGENRFDAVIGIFFCIIFPDAELQAMARSIHGWLVEGGVFYGLDPSRYRLSGAVGSLLVPRLMRRYQTPDERELIPSQAVRWFAEARFKARFQMYDFLSAPFAGLFQTSVAGYRAVRLIDEVLIRIPGLRMVGSNFELIARKAG